MPIVESREAVDAGHDTWRLEHPLTTARNNEKEYCTLISCVDCGAQFIWYWTPPGADHYYFTNPPIRAGHERTA